jgi:hypothetical protein
MALNAFQPQGNTVLVAATSSTAVAATQITTSVGVAGCYVANPSSALAIYIAFGTSAVAAACPTTAVPAVGMCIPFGTARTFTIAPSSANNWISAVTSGGSANGVFVTPGFGQ